MYGPTVRYEYSRPRRTATLRRPELRSSSAPELAQRQFSPQHRHGPRLGKPPPPWVAVETADAWKPLTEEHEPLCFETRIRVLVDAAGGPQNSALYSAIHGNFPPEAVWVAEPADGPTGILGR